MKKKRNSAQSTPKKRHNTTPKAQRKNHNTTPLLFLAFLAGLALVLYPSVSDYWNSFHQTRAIAVYSEEVANMDDNKYDELFEAAYAYNQSLIQKKDRYTMSDEERAEYESLLDVSGNGILGYIEIPIIGCSLPIYHGTDAAVLQIAVGHIEGTSLPVGGAGCHSVLSGHRGLPSAKLFTDLDRLTFGDTFIIQVLNQTYTYEVDQILIVLPYEMDLLAIDPAKDYCTLVTCTPYGINSHRLLVRGHRIENEEIAQTVRVTADALQIDPIVVAPVVAMPMLLVLFIVLMIPKKTVTINGGNSDEEF
jgi:sortase family protein